MPPRLDPPLDDERRHAVAETWAFRQRTEREAAARFGRLARQLREQGATPAVLELADKAVRDEERHVVLCGDVAVAYGRAECKAAPGAPEVGPPRAVPRDRLLYEVVAFCCVVAQERRRARDGSSGPSRSRFAGAGAGAGAGTGAGTGAGA